MCPIIAPSIVFHSNFPPCWQQCQQCCCKSSRNQGGPGVSMDGTDTEEKIEQGSADAFCVVAIVWLCKRIFFLFCHMHMQCILCNPNANDCFAKQGNLMTSCSYWAGAVLRGSNWNASIDQSTGETFRLFWLMELFWTFDQGAGNKLPLQPVHFGSENPL